MLYTEYDPALPARGDLQVARETFEWINLYSKWRGTNRFPGLVLTIDFLAERPEVLRRRPRLPALTGLRDWIGRETKLGNPALRAEVDATGDPDLALALEWSEAVNRSIEEIVKEVPPFPFVRESLEIMTGKADVMVVSATPARGPRARVGRARPQGHVALIAGQECGSKKEHLALAAVGRYEPAKILMVGDAPGDCERRQGQRRALLSDRPGLRGCVVAAVLRGGPAAILRRDVRRRIHGRPDRPVRGLLPDGRRGNEGEKNAAVSIIGSIRSASDPGWKGFGPWRRLTTTEQPQNSTAGPSAAKPARDAGDGDAKQYRRLD